MIFGVLIQLAFSLPLAQQPEASLDDFEALHNPNPEVIDNMDRFSNADETSSPQNDAFQSSVKSPAFLQNQQSLGYSPQRTVAQNLLAQFLGLNQIPTNAQGQNLPTNVESMQNQQLLGYNPQEYGIVQSPLAQLLGLAPMQNNNPQINAQAQNPPRDENSLQNRHLLYNPQATAQSSLAQLLGLAPIPQTQNYNPQANLQQDPSLNPVIFGATPGISNTPQQNPGTAQFPQ